MGFTLVSNYDIFDFWIKKVCVFFDILVFLFLLVFFGGLYWLGWFDILVEVIGYFGLLVLGDVYLVFVFFNRLEVFGVFVYFLVFGIWFGFCWARGR